MESRADMPELIRIGTAGWTIPRQCAEHFPRDGSRLERYAAQFTAVEINSTFHRSHKPHTFARRADGVPEGFRFAVNAEFAYYRLHGAPRMYYSAYDCAFVAELAAQIRGAAAKEVWCIFDNTALGAATANALAMQTQLAISAVRKASP
jgi:uncharacterized protein YecE (DUF72 family)